MNLIQRQTGPQRFLFALIVFIGVFAKSTSSTSAGFNRLDAIHIDDDSNLHKAAMLSRTLANRNHTKIDSLRNAFIDKFLMQIDLREITHNRNSYLKGVIANHKLEWQTIKQSANEFLASNEALMKKIFNTVLGNDENNADQLNAQIVRHQLTAPMKVIQALLKFAVDADAPNKKQLWQNLIEQLKYKPCVLKEVLDDFDYQLRQGSLKLIAVKRAIVGLMQQADEILTSKKVSTIDMLKSLSDAFSNLPNVLEKAKPKDAKKDVINLVNRMKSLATCPELGIAAYRDCRNNPTKLAAYVAHVNKSQDLLQKWKDYELTVYSIVIPALKEIEDLPEEQRAKKMGSSILSIIPKLDNFLGEMPLYSHDFNRIFAETKQLTRLTASLLNGAQVLSDREMLLWLFERIRSIDSHDAEMLNDEITSNLLLEACMRARESLKLHVFAIDQDYLELCDIPSPPASNPINSKYIEQSLLRNMQILDAKIKSEDSRDRPGAGYVFQNTPFLNERPFFVWKYKDFKDEIKRLLSGELATLNADILASTHQNAVKFNKFLFDFRLVKKSKQNEFYKVINGMRLGVEMIGDHYYRCDKRIYYVPTDVRLPNAYNIQINDKNEIGVVNASGIYAAIIDKKPFLSPHTVWQIKFTEKLGREGKLKEFLDEELDLHLIGVGSEAMNYDGGKKLCYNDELKKNYRLDRILK